MRFSIQCYIQYHHQTEADRKEQSIIYHFSLTIIGEKEPSRLLFIIKKGMVVPPSHGFLHPITSGGAVQGILLFPTCPTIIIGIERG